MKRLAVTVIAVAAFGLTTGCDEIYPCYNGVAEALANGGQEDEACRGWITPEGRTVVGPGTMIRTDDIGVFFASP